MIISRLTLAGKVAVALNRHPSSINDLPTNCPDPFIDAPGFASFVSKNEDLPIWEIIIGESNEG